MISDTQRNARKRKAADVSVRTLDRWFVSKDKQGDGSSKDEIAITAPRAKRRAVDDLRVRRTPARASIAWVQLPAYTSDFIKGFETDERSVNGTRYRPTPPTSESEDQSRLPSLPLRTAPSLRANGRQSRGSLARTANRISFYEEKFESEDESDARSEMLSPRNPDSASDFAGTSESDSTADPEPDDSSSVDASDVSDSERDTRSTKKPSAKAAKVPPVAPRNATAGRPMSKNMKNLLTRKAGEARELDKALPPLYEIDAIFQDLVKRANGMGFGDAVYHLRSRKLRIATMCSGTESPLLALEMIRDSLKALGGDTVLEIDHLFSGEIVPFKQAYIERNFHPPIIFRDITELVDAIDRNQDDLSGRDIPLATTAYGGKVPVPTDIDICIAGTSCVDFSGLNGFKKGIDGGGESDKTWHAVLTYCNKFRPAIVILENVRNADWDTMLRHYEDIDYESSGVLVDTKDFYIPQTRQRGYMVCFDKHRMEKAAVRNAGQKWASLMEQFKRPVSAPVTAFLIPNDKIRSRPQMLDDDQATREVDWTQCEVTQMEYRQDKRLGNARPYTNWQESGGIVPPDNANTRWYPDQVERVLDTIDAAHLRKALEVNGMFDSRYKTRIWNLSQNIYRDEDRQPFGIVGCITPSGLFFVSDIGRALTAEELLKLQGLPIDRISFTTETPAEMQDLAGNAMSTTVVGSAILSALIAGHKIIDTPHSTDLLSQENGSIQIRSQASTERPILFNSSSVPMTEMLDKARSSLRKCYCEGASSIAEKAIQQCTECGHTSCIACGGNPAHEYRSNRALNEGRLAPTAFQDYLRSVIPLTLGIELDTTAITNMGADYKKVVKRAVQNMFTYQKIRRTHCWTVTYSAPDAQLELVITQSQAQWRLYATPPSKLPANNPLRAILAQPIARADIEDSLIDVEWLLRHPTETSSPITIKESGLRLASWWSRNQMPDFIDHSVPEYLEVNVAPGEDEELARTISGRYKYLPYCGKASDSLFKKTPTMPNEDYEKVFLFLDPSRTGPSDEDCFVFSTSKEDIESDEVRPVLAKIDSSWRPWAQSDRPKKKAKLLVKSQWIASDCRLRIMKLNGNIALPASLDCFGIPTCSELHSLIECEIPVDLGSDQLVKTHDNKVFWDHAWIFEILRRNLPPSSKEWQNIKNLDHCATCAPERPNLRWRLGEKGALQPYEDQETATRYERQIKGRPEVILAEITSNSAKSRITLGLDIPSLAHRAVSRLSNTLPDRHIDVKCSWRFVTESESSKYTFRSFRLQTTSDVGPHDAEVGMTVRLFPKQCIALAWMRQQELGVTFRLEDTEEANIPSLSWRAEVRAHADVTVRGGICADHPGFGKTITSLALIRSQLDDNSGKAEPILARLRAEQNQRDDIEGLIPVAATLIVCPHSLVDQWMAEIQSKLGKGFALLVVRTTAVLLKLTRENFEKAKIILVSRSVFGSETYTERLAAFAAMPPPATNSGRSFGQWLKFASKKVPVHLGIRKKDGLASFKKYIEKTYKQNLNSDLFKAVVPSKRLRGAAFAAEVAKKAGGRTSMARAKGTAPSTVDTTSIDMPLFEMFYFNRLIVDEFHQYEQREFASIVALKAHSRWGLSATPALGDFYDISQIARLLGVSLPIGSDQRGIMKVKNIRELRRDMTDFERFDAMRVVPTSAMHERIHSIDQRFLDTFVRQNIMDFDELKYEDHLVPVTLRMAHRAVYTELSQHLNSANMRIKKGNKSKTTDRQVLINDAISTSSTAEEALSKAAAFSEDADLNVFMRRRQQELTQLLDDQIPKALRDARQKEPVSFEKLRKRHESDILGDKETREDLLRLFNNTGTGAKPKSKTRRDSFGEDGPTGDSKAQGKRVLTAALNVLCNRLVVARRSLRYLENVLELQKAQSNQRRATGPKAVVLCDNSDCAGGSSNGAVSSFCGHAVCSDCFSLIKQKGSKQCPAQGCSSALHDHHLLWLNKMGLPTGTPYGAKIETAIRLLKEIEARGDQAILFVQFPTQLAEIEAALAGSGIAATVVKTLGESGRQIQDFRESASTPARRTVIVLNASDETAAGSNLQNANHVVFLSPLLRDTRYGYESTMAQAVGRVRRHGQKKGIHVYRLVALDTIDVDILEHRERRATALVEQGAPGVKAPGVKMPLTKVVRGERERTQLVKEDGRFSLRPRSWLVDSGEQDVERVKGKSRVLGWEDFSSLVKFSRAFTEDDD